MTAIDIFMHFCKYHKFWYSRKKNTNSLMFGARQSSRFCNNATAEFMQQEVNFHSTSCKDYSVYALLSTMTMCLLISTASVFLLLQHFYELTAKRAWPIWVKSRISPSDEQVYEHHSPYFRSKKIVLVPVSEHQQNGLSSRCRLP